MTIENINWYPGHMKKTRELIRDSLKLVDAVIEVVDARIPRSSRNPVIDELTGSKPRLIVLNKCDLADRNENARWISRFESEGKKAFATDSMHGTGIKELVRQTGTAAEPAGRGPVRLVINNEDGSSIAFNPLSSIEKIPSSSTEPKRFFRARKKRTSSSVLSKEITVSTRCSRTLGPAMFPSFVTWAVKNKTLSLSLTQDTSS